MQTEYERLNTRKNKLEQSINQGSILLSQLNNNIDGITKLGMQDTFLKTEHKDLVNMKTNVEKMVMGDVEFLEEIEKRIKELHYEK